MRTKVLIFALFALTLIALGTLVTVIFNTAPATRDVIWLFYVSLWLTVFGLVFFGLFARNFTRNRTTPPWQSTLAAFRYSVVGATLASVLIALNANNLLTIPNALVVFLALGLAELTWRRRGSTAS